MPSDPWFNEFWFLNCPECTFKTKIENTFLDHAVENHPVSSKLFSSSKSQINDEITIVKDITDPLSLESTRLENASKSKEDKTLEEIMYPESDEEAQTRKSNKIE